MTVEQIIGQALGSSGVAAVMYLWIRDLRQQLKTERAYLVTQAEEHAKKDAARQEQLLKLAEAGASTTAAVRDRLRNIEYALRLRSPDDATDGQQLAPVSRA